MLYEVITIPSRVTLSLDIRAPEDGQRERGLEELLNLGEAIAKRRELQFGHDCFYSSPATPCAPGLQAFSLLLYYYQGFRTRPLFRT